MAKKNRVDRPKDELKRELIDQLSLLRNACETFDRGLEVIGKHISLSLRVLLHQHGNSRALLDQLGFRTGRFFDSAGKLNPKNMLAECNLIVMFFSPSGGSYKPVVAAGGGPYPMKLVPFAEWWNNPVFKDGRGRTFCRRELVGHVADTDGGAHVDPQLDEAYMAISRQNSLGFTFSVGNGFKDMEGRAELACMRQIAHELLTTLHELVPELKTHALPVLPSSVSAGSAL